MRLSANTIGAALFTVAGIALFVLMAKRMPEEGAGTSAMNFGMPLSEVGEKAPEPVTLEEAPKTIEATPVISDPVEPETPVMPEIEPVKAEVEAKVEDTAATMPATTTSETSEISMPESTETKVGEMPATTPADVPAAEGSMPAN